MDNKREKENEIRKTMQGVKWYRGKIVEIVNQINNEKYLKMIYGFVNRLHKE